MIAHLELENLTPTADLSRMVTGGYAADLLSCVMAGAKSGNVWVTLQGHPNIVAVASLLGLTAIVVTEDAPIDPHTLEKAADEDVAVLSSPQSTWAVVAALAAQGVAAGD
ncbi:MAG: hypothetical protein KKA73_08040 [Chloroflexi bacterium]|nr:hypothetical protein [Chloroflexota bacterium]MBU1747624.1 hypothetical protein [Chloroflexota bacterium]MBU1879698.1 hypothetical protein [Chloroflexota bacterium]